MKILQLNDELFGMNHRFTFVKSASIFYRVFAGWKFTEFEVENEDNTTK